MRRINEAYQAIVATETQRFAATPVAATQRMSPEEIDAFSRAIGSDGPVDWALGSIGWVGNAIEGMLGILSAVGLAVRLLVELPRGDFTAFREHPEFIIVALLLVVLVVRELAVRKRVSDPTSRPAP